MPAANASKFTARKHPIAKNGAIAAATVAALGALLASTAGTAAAAPAAVAAVAVAYQRVIPFTAASVTAGEKAGTLQVAWTSPVKHVSVYAGFTESARGTLVGSGSGVGDITVSDEHGSWIRLVPSTGAPLTLTIRDLGLASDPNLRDIGGYRTGDGQWVKMGVAYRSQALTLTPADADVVNTLGITRDIDLRRAPEIASAPDVVPAGASYENLNVLANMPAALLTGAGINTVAEAEKAMEEGEVFMASDENSRTGFGTLIAQVADSRGAILYHCTAGKDRTGWATGLILSLLGVPESTVNQDYVLSNDYYFDSPAVQAALKTLPPAEAKIDAAMGDVQPAYLDAGLQYVTQHFGTIENYATTPVAKGGLGLTQQTLANLRHRLLAG